MHTSIRLLAVYAAAGISVACLDQTQPSSAGAAVELETEAQKFGYAVGIDLGNSLDPVSDSIDVAALKAGIDDVTAANARIEAAKAALDANPEDEAAQQALQEAIKMPDLRMDVAAREEVKATVSQRLQEENQREIAAAAGAAAEAGKKFLEQNGQREGVITTDSGLQYEVLEAGEGKSPKASDEVTVHYTGTLLDGEVFDSSVERGQPVTFPLNNVIPGWTEGVQLMKTGAKYKFFIPSELAYADRGAGGKIGPNETLIFDVELIEIK